MNSESTAIAALILILILGFFAFVFFGNNTDPNSVPTDEPFQVEPSPGEIITSDTQPEERASRFIEVQFEPSEPEVVESPLATRSIEDLIVVTSPVPLQEIVSPLLVEGKARGYWFFEADFPVMLTDSNGKIIARDNARAKSDWMTEEFVQFSTMLEFKPDYGKPGVLIIRNHNPSDLTENNREVKIPIVFADRETMEVQVFFGNHKLDPDVLLEEAFPTTRIVPKNQAIARVALDELLKGPTEKEQEDGYYSSINSGVKVQSLSIINGVARVDFNPQLEYEVAGSTRVGAIKTQIIQTLTQFPTVKDVIISIDGRTEDILQP